MRALSLISAAVLTLTPTLTLADAGRVISIGGANTEIIHALGAADRLVARDTTSTFPPSVEDLPDVGYARALSPESVLSFDADLVIATENAGPPATLDVLEAAQTELVMVPETYTTDGILAKIAMIGAALGLEAEAEALSDEVAAQLAEATALAETRAGADKPRVLFILSAANGRIMAAGTDTGAEGILHMAGAQNALTGLAGYKPVTDEAITLAAPDVILMMDRGGDHAVADDDLFALPAIASTPAGQNKRIVRMDGLRLLGFGPRTADAVHELSSALHGVES